MGSLPDLKLGSKLSNLKRWGSVDSVLELTFPTMFVSFMAGSPPLPNGDGAR